MSTEVVVPTLGESIAEATLGQWLKQPGDTIARDEALLEISTDKVDTEIPSTVAGVLNVLGQTAAIFEGDHASSPLL